MKKYSLGVVIGRFQPVHQGHIENILVPALEQCDRVLVTLGSCHKPRTIKNPFTAIQREGMILEALRSHYDYPQRAEFTSLSFRDARDFPYDNNRWRAQILRFAHEFEDNDSKIALFGAEKDHSSFYLKFFPLWALVEPEGLGNGYSSTVIREYFFSDSFKMDALHAPADLFTKNMVNRGLPSCNIVTLSNWVFTEEGKRLKTEYDHIKKYKAQFESYPYPPIFHTVDNVVLYNGHILLVQRGAMPGKGLWALPGGFLNANEWAFQGAMRELAEETGLKPKPEWYNPEPKTFDHPGRSLRGRTITTAFLCVVPSRFPAPSVKGMDDADRASWIPMDRVLGDSPAYSNIMFEDHIDIIREMVERA